MADTDSFWKYISWGKLSVKELGVLSFPRVPLSVFFFVFFLQVLAEVRGFTLKKKKKVLIYLPFLVLEISLS